MGWITRTPHQNHRRDGQQNGCLFHIYIKIPEILLQHTAVINKARHSYPLSLKAGLPGRSPGGCSPAETKEGMQCCKSKSQERFGCEAGGGAGRSSSGGALSRLGCCCGSYCSAIEGLHIAVHISHEQ